MVQVEMTKETKNKIEMLKGFQEMEVENDFANGDLWNALEDAISNLTNHGQMNYPEPIFDEEGLEVGYRRNDGSEVYWEGMSIYNSYD